MDECKPACIINGESWWHYLYEYDWEGSTYGFSIAARSEEEAHARLKRLPLARYLGQGDGGQIPVLLPPWLGGALMMRLTVWYRNWLQRAWAKRR
jgi:hypothetical protein